jgi:hypothetical protein
LDRSKRSLEQQVAEVIDARVQAREDNRGRAELLNDGRATNAITRLEALPRINRGRDETVLKINWALSRTGSLDSTW